MPTASLALACALSAVVVAAPRGSAADSLDPDAARIAAAKHSLEWNWTPPGHAGRYGHAETLIHAPIEAVRARVLDFGHYKDMMSGHFESSRVVGHGPDHSTDVYIRISVFRGVVMLWNVTRFGPVREVSPGLEMLEGRMVQGRGNVEDMNAVWTMRALGDGGDGSGTSGASGGWTVLKLDLILKPGLPAPQGAMDEELRDSARHAVDSIHDHVEGSPEISAWP
jgi:hypothetical protein